MSKSLLPQIFHMINQYLTRGPKDRNVTEEELDAVESFVKRAIQIRVKQLHHKHSNDPVAAKEAIQRLFELVESAKKEVLGEHTLETVG